VGPAEVIADSSALIVILDGEPETSDFQAAINAHHTWISAATSLETAIVLKARHHHILDEFLTQAEISVVPFDAEQAKVAREGYARFGKSSGSKAQLNVGDCMTYALAKVTGEPLLFKGYDFIHTDITPAL
jgi:ribonuclease VapC